MSANTSAKLIDASAGVTSSQASTVQVNAGYRGGHIVINTTAVATGASLTPSIIGLCNNVEYTILTGDVISSTGVTILKIYPGIGSLVNGAVSDILPNQWRLDVAVTGGSVSFTANGNLVR